MNDDLTAKLDTLGISDHHIRTCKLLPFSEATNLTQCENDMFDRIQYMTPETLKRWQQMKRAAAEAKVTLVLVSAFRSIDYQCSLIANKIEKGQDIDSILSVNAIPGFSEHHTGRALDLSTPDCEPLSEAFDQTDAFTWLVRHASDFDFEMSFPRDNSAGIIYEPWHWTCQIRDQDAPRPEIF